MQNVFKTKRLDEITLWMNEYKEEAERLNFQHFNIYNETDDRSSAKDSMKS